MPTDPPPRPRTIPPGPVLTSRQTPAPPLGPPEASDDAPDSVSARGGRLGTVPLRPLIDIGQAGLTLTVEREAGNVVERALVHEGDVVRIGTHASNDLVLDDPSVSRFHCRIVPDAAGWRVEDSGSLNGTRLQELRILGAVLPAEAVLSVGNSVIRIVAHPAAGKTLVPMMPSFGALTGTGRAMRKLFAVLEKVAASEINCFIQGENGTGKELVATEIVQRGPRASKPFVVVDCGSISPNLVESELFGHVRGAFTGADRAKPGLLELADGGSVFLDEIGELPLGLQARLLRVLQDRKVQRIGALEPRAIDVRFIAATNRELPAEVAAGRFRQDLYYRLDGVTLSIPPLRLRSGEIAGFARSFLAEASAQLARPLRLSRGALARLEQHAWPGNIRELRNVIERAALICPADEIDEEHLQLADERDAPAASGSLHADVESLERRRIVEALEACGGNQTRAAAKLGISRGTLVSRLKQFGITRPRG